MPSGTVKTWNVAKGFGFVVLDDGRDVFVHTSSLNGGSLKQGEAVTLDVKESGHKSQRLVGENVSGAGVVKKSSKKGQHTGTVSLWIPAKSYGFIKSKDGEDIYVHNSSFGGGRLEEGKEVNYDLESVEHKSGRKIAINVSGPAVATVGEKSGVVTSWLANKGCGFAKMDDGKEVFVHRSEIKNGHLAKGKTIFFDLADKTHESGRLVATNVSGQAVRSGKGGSRAPATAQGGWQEQGVIMSWRTNFGFANTASGEVYIHKSAGGPFKEGTRVVITYAPSAHPSGRLIAQRAEPIRSNQGWKR